MTLPGFASTAPAPTTWRDTSGDRLHPQTDMHCETFCSNMCANECEDAPPWEAGDCLNGCTDRCIDECEPPHTLTW
ncbi:hypothetical protein B7P34_20815 [Streptosporangium nondiastaticum]|uniref:Uncharacterized protein n=1 Tax=Streptosporangium nondiastaticum TaxID=35764 RepID=A0A9X7PGB9_9ACTN|nr:hypothetical protein B7P34_20815 [Streptosporangium nondiastaticum]